MIYLFYALFFSANPVVIAKHPRAATPWIQSLRANCGSTKLEVSGFGAARPLERVAKITVDKRPIIGQGSNRLLSDLSHRRAVYRLQVLCDDSREITLRIGIGEKQVDGRVRFRSGAAFFTANKLVTYTGLQEADSDGFWFR